MKDLLIKRFISLSRQLNHPGFDDSDEVLLGKFGTLPDAAMLTIFELIVLEAHRAGIQ